MNYYNLLDVLTLLIEFYILYKIGNFLISIYVISVPRDKWLVWKLPLRRNSYMILKTGLHFFKKIIYGYGIFKGEYYTMDTCLFTDALLFHLPNGGTIRIKDVKLKINVDLSNRDKKTMEYLFNLLKKVNRQNKNLEPREIELKVSQEILSKSLSNAISKNEGLNGEVSVNTGMNEVVTKIEKWKEEIEVNKYIEYESCRIYISDFKIKMTTVEKVLKTY